MLSFFSVVAAKLAGLPGIISTVLLWRGGRTAVLNVAAAAAIKTGPGTLVRIVVVVAPTANNLTVNDNNVTGGTNVAANTILDVAFGALTKGQVITLEWPCAVGITISSVGTNGVYAVSYT
jgi:hypothetical protein